MKKMVFFFVFAATLIGCERVDFGPEIKDGTLSSAVIMRSGKFKSDVGGAIYVEKDVMTSFSIESKTENLLIDASWEINGITYSSLNIFYRFESLGQKEIKVNFRFANNETGAASFPVEVVSDLRAKGPLIIKAEKNSDGKFNVLFLWDKRWLKAFAGPWSFIGSVTAWQKEEVTESANYVLDSLNQAKKTSDIGKYLGFSLELEAGEHSVALVDKNGYWVDVSGSIYSEAEEAGLVRFRLDDNGKIFSTAQIEKVDLPGEKGDDYFRFTKGDPSILFFKLDSAFNEKAFAIRGLSGGEYSEPILLTAVDSFPDWGKIFISQTYLDGVSSWRYGKNSNALNEYEASMRASIFFSPEFNCLKLSIVNLDNHY